MIGMLWRTGRRFFRFMLVVLLGYLCQVCVMPYFAVNNVTPSLLFAVTAIVTVCYGKLRAFWVGGIICMAGQAVADLSTLWFHLPANAALTMGSVFLVFLTALLTGIGVFDKIAQYAGAGTVVPITGFANAMVSPAMEFKPEGWVLGTGARLFTIAGPVLVYGISASVVVGILYYFIRW